MKGMYSIGGTGHIGTLGDTDTAVVEQCFGMLDVKLVLRGTRQSDIARHLPRLLCLMKSSGCIFFGIFRNSTASIVLQVHHVLQFFGVDTVLVVDIATGIGKRHHFATQLNDLFGGELGHISGSGDDHIFPGNILILGF